MTTSTLAKNQAARRRRMMQSALELAAEGGFDAVQMRDVAARADVALGTLYRYFPSKEALLVSVLNEDVEQLATALAARPPKGDSPAERVSKVLSTAIKLHPERDVIAALVKALASGRPEVSDLVREVNETMTSIIVRAMHEGEPAEAERRAARILQQVWIASLLGWIGGVHDRAQILADVEAATEALLGPETGGG